MAEETGEAVEDPKLEQAVFGRDVEFWIETDPIGQYVIARARQDLEEVKEALVTVDPCDAQAIRALQHKAGIAISIRDWLGQAIAAGRSATDSLQQERDEHG